MIRAIDDMVIVKLHVQDKIGLIYVPDQAKQYSGDIYGEVISIGPNYKYDLEVGDKVIVERHEGVQIEYGNDKYLAMRSNHVLAKREEQ